ncbi:MAG: F0F1 ATP synthase subunit B [Planctomycetes bacterium]|nr:F0F1 ATP synthase subunit B [Planctomycetota bacterium]
MSFDETFWVAVAFVLFVGLVFRPAGRMIIEALDSRAEKIRGELDEAVRLREEAQALLARYQRQQNEAAEQAEEILAHARDEAERQAAHAADAVEVALGRRESQALDRIARAEQEAMAEVRGAAVDAAVRATRRLLAEKLDAEGHAALIDAAVSGLDKKLH